MNRSLSVKALYLFAGLLILLQAYLVYHEFYWFYVLPLVLLVLAALFLALDKFFFVAVFCAPLSIEIDVGGMNLGLSLPCEPMLIALTFMYWLKLLLEQHADWKYWRHPLVLLTLFHLGWMLVSAMFSEHPLVSFKYLATRIWFTSSMFFLGIHIFKKENNIHQFIWTYVVPLCGVVIYTLVRHAHYNFEKQPAHWVMDPFFQDHTHYGAMLAFFMPVMLITFIRTKANTLIRLLLFLACLIIAVGLVMSISRAAWLSIIGAAGVLTLFLLRIRWYTVLGAVAIVAGTAYMYRTEIIMEMEKTKAVSSGEFTEHFKSATNIRSDASNTERLLRWKAALRMFEERPVTGFGPGTYQFCYAPYQRSYELTIISTNFGDGGNAHSEYLGPLAEQGVLGLLSILSLAIMSIVVGARVIFHPLVTLEQKWLAYGIMLGLVTYFLHGFLNNFLNTDEASVPFWGFLAMLTAMDLQLGKKAKDAERSTGFS